MRGAGNSCTVTACCVGMHRAKGCLLGTMAERQRKKLLPSQVEQLSRFSVRAPTRSELFYGDFEVRGSHRRGACMCWTDPTQAAAMAASCHGWRRGNFNGSVHPAVDRSTGNTSVSRPHQSSCAAARSRTARSRQHQAGRSEACPGGPSSQGSACGRASRRASWSTLSSSRRWASCRAPPRSRGS